MVLAPNVIQKYNLGPVKPWVSDAAYFLGPRHGIKVIGGWRATDQFPDHPSGHAIDIMVPNTTVGNAVAQDAINISKALGIIYPSYLIWNRRVWNSQKGWHPYTSTSNPHTDHVHITMWNAGVGVPGGAVPTADNTSATDTTAVSTVDATCAWSIKFPVTGSSCIATHVALRKGMSGLLFGGCLIVGLVAVTLLILQGVNSSNTTKNLTRAARGFM